MTRYVTKRSVPDTPHVCVKQGCIYSIEGNGVCEQPRTHRGNSDAFCHGVRPSEVIAWLTSTANSRRLDDTETR